MTAGFYGLLSTTVRPSDWRDDYASIIFLCIFLLGVIAFFIWWLRR